MFDLFQNLQIRVLANLQKSHQNRKSSDINIHFQSMICHFLGIGNSSVTHLQSPLSEFICKHSGFHENDTIDLKHIHSLSTTIQFGFITKQTVRIYARRSVETFVSSGRKKKITIKLLRTAN